MTLWHEDIAFDIISYYLVYSLSKKTNLSLESVWLVIIPKNFNPI